MLWILNGLFRNLGLIVSLALFICLISVVNSLNPGTKWRNRNCFAVLTKKGGVIGYGGPTNSTACTGVPESIQESGVKQVYSNSEAFLAIRTDLTLSAWGNVDYGGALPANLEGEVALDIACSHSAFAVKVYNKSVFSWGYFYGDEQHIEIVDVDALYSNNYAFCALHSDGSLTTFGPSKYGGKLPDVCGAFNDYTAVFSSYSGFLAIRSNGHVCSWGDGIDDGQYKNMTSSENASGNYGGWTVSGGSGNATWWNNTNTIASVKETNSKAVYTTYGAFASVSKDKILSTWGASDADFGNFGSALPAAAQHNDIVGVYATYSAFSAITSSGKVIAWGDPEAGGDLGSEEINDAIMIAGNYRAFCALTSEGRVRCWGDKDYYGGSVPLDLRNVTALYANDVGFAAVTANSTVIGWGSAAYNIDFVNKEDAYVVYGNTYFRAVSIFPDFYDLENGILPNNDGIPTSNPTPQPSAPTVKPTEGPTVPFPTSSPNSRKPTKGPSWSLQPTITPTSSGTSNILIDVTLYISGVTYTQWKDDKSDYDAVVAETVVKVIDHEDQISTSDISEISLSEYNPAKEQKQSQRRRVLRLLEEGDEQVVATFQIISPGSTGLTNDEIVKKLETAQEKGYFTEELRATSKEDSKTPGLDDATIESVDAKPKSSDPPASGSSGKKKLDTGSIIGIAAAGVVFAILSGLTAYYFGFIRRDGSVKHVDNLDEFVRSSVAAPEVRSPVHDGYGIGPQRTPQVAPPAPPVPPTPNSEDVVRDSIPDASQGDSAPTSPAPPPPDLVAPKVPIDEDEL